MRERLISEYSSFVFLFVGLLFFFFRLYTMFYIVLVVWYFLFGFVGLAYLFSTSRKIKLSGLFILLTVPVFLIPFRKALYYWTRAVNTIFKDPSNVEETLKFAKLVNIDNLYTDNNKCMFYSFLSSIYFDLNQRDLSKEYLDKAKRTPHKMVVNIAIEHLDNLLKSG